MNTVDKCILGAVAWLIALCAVSACVSEERKTITVDEGESYVFPLGENTDDLVFVLVAGPEFPLVDAHPVHHTPAWKKRCHNGFITVANGATLACEPW